MTQPPFTNKLIDETSPYLQQHAHNPVNWYPWGEEALQRARTEDRPILLSIGYSACHWCHVMEHESFENQEIADLMNRDFICIKVDREERPDIDSIYMTAVQMMTGQGGWPLTVFLTPDLKPFYGGTYYPPYDRGGMPGFPRVLTALASAYREQREEVARTGDNIAAELRKGNANFREDSTMLATDILDRAIERMIANFDSVNGGFGGAPKFPPSMNLMFLLSQSVRAGSRACLDVVELTLDRMAAGGIYDHLGGGFHRYSVDDRWLVPHFEKMLYDNALLARIYLYAFQATKKTRYREVAEETLEYVIRDMMSPKGGFYSSEDADSEGHEGKFYTWSKEEIYRIVGADEAALFCEFFDVTDRGNFEHGQSILNIPVPLGAFSATKGIKEQDLRSMLNRAKKTLFNYREQRIRPGKDDKILTAWNGLMLTAFAEAGNILDRDDYRAIAARNADFILKSLTGNGRLLRTYKDGKAKLNGYAEDYAYVIEGLLALYEATFDLKYFEKVLSFTDILLSSFADDAEAGFFFTGSDHEELIARMKEYFDNAIPSANSAAARALLKLSLLTGESRFQSPALGILRMLQEPMGRYPSGFGYLLCALDFYLSQPKEIAIAGDPES
ncbi:MAG TPA: thioredoxin domain-containing protein, partial [Blastocatellia bacterium]